MKAVKITNTTNGINTIMIVDSENFDIFLECCKNIWSKVEEIEMTKEMLENTSEYTRGFTYKTWRE